MEPSELEARARRAYEGGRWRKGAVAALWAVPPTLFALWGCSPERVWIHAPLLMAAAVLWTWRGGTSARGVVPGLKAGTLPTLVPLVVHACAWSPMPRACLLTCVGGGLAAGAFMSVRAFRARESSPELWAAGLFAVVTGALGCQMFGLSGLIGLGAGVLAGTTPGYVFTLRRSAVHA
jgi:hypothetical protein